VSATRWLSGSSACVSLFGHRGYNAITYRVLAAASEMQIDLMTPLEVDSIVQDGRRVPFRPFESDWVELKPGQRMHYVDEGAGDVLLFLHGTPTWSFAGQTRFLTLALSSFR
jgi:hypothetical protein